VVSLGHAREAVAGLRLAARLAQRVRLLEDVHPGDAALELLHAPAALPSATTAAPAPPPELSCEASAVGFLYFTRSPGGTALPLCPSHS
jgi:hypothetical protein